MKSNDIRAKVTHLIAIEKSFEEAYKSKNIKSMTENWYEHFKIVKFLGEDEEVQLLGKNEVFLNFMVSGITKSLNYGLNYISEIDTIIEKQMNKNGKKIEKKTNIVQVIEVIINSLLQSLKNIKLKVSEVEEDSRSDLINKIINIINSILIIGNNLIQTASILINYRSQSRIDPLIELTKEYTKRLNIFINGIDEDGSDQDEKDLLTIVTDIRSKANEIISPAIPNTDDGDEQKNDDNYGKDHYENDPEPEDEKDVNEHLVVSYHNKLYETVIHESKIKDGYDPQSSPKFFTEIKLADLGWMSRVVNIDCNDFLKTDAEFKLQKGDYKSEEFKPLIEEMIGEFYEDINIPAGSLPSIKKAFSLKATKENYQELFINAKKLLSNRTS